MKKILRFCTILLSCILLFSAVASAAEEQGETTVEITVGNVQTDSSEILIVRTISIEIRTTDYDTRMEQMMQAVSDADGERTTWRDVEGDLRIRTLETEVRTENLDRIESVYAGEALYFYDDDFSEDITEAYRTVEGELAIARAKEHPDPAEILRLEGMLADYDHHLAYCTVRIKLAELSVSETAADADASEFSDLLWYFLAFAALIGLLLLILWIVKRIKRRRHRKRRTIRSPRETWPNETRAWVGEDNEGNVKTEIVNDLPRHSYSPSHEGTRTDFDND